MVGATPSFSDATVVAGETYWYRVVVTDSDTPESEDTSNEVQAVVPLTGGGAFSMLLMGVG